MATYAAFLRDTGVDGNTVFVNGKTKEIGIKVGSIYGETYYVDNVTGVGSDSNDGLSWSSAVATITQAITLSNAYRAVTANAQKRNTIFISGGVYSETVSALPSRCDIVGIGTACTGNWTVPTGGRAAGCHLHGIYWSKSGSTSLVSFTECSSLEIDTCQFYAAASNAIGIEIIGCAKTYIHDCTLFGNNNFTHGIKFTSGSCYGCRVERNRIFAQTIGIWVEDATHCQTGVICYNIIANKHAGGGGQCDIGIDVNGSYPPEVFSNWVSAVDGILLTGGFIDDNIDNHLSQAGTGAVEIDASS